MSNLSDIGFPVRGDEAVNEMIMSVLNSASEVRCPTGFYLKFSDKSGAEIWLQGNFDQELIGFNPHFAGKSRRRVALTQAIERETSALDGGFHGWADPSDETNVETGEYPFVFDSPDFRTVPDLPFPQTVEVQLTAFASNDLQVFANKKDYDESQDGELKYAVQSFVPTGLFTLDESGNAGELGAVRPIGRFSGEIKEFALKTNSLTNEKFYWFLVEILGGEVDIVADPNYVPNKPQIGGIVSGQFWLSGRIIR